MGSHTHDPLVELFRHHLWANLRLLDSCESLNDAQLDATAHGTYGSIRRTLTHLAGSEESYVARLTGEQFDDAIRAGEVLGLEDLRAHLRHSGEALIQVAGRTGEIGSIRVAWAESVWQVPPGVILAQAINHANHHREQVCAILTGLGIQPPDIQAWEYGWATGRVRDRT